MQCATPSLLVNNLSRPGAIANMTLEEFARRKKEKEGFVLQVFNHKTKKGGPAPVSVSFKGYVDIRKYIDFVKCKVPHLNTEHVFAS